MNECVQEPAVITETQVQQLVAKARVAQAVFESFSQEQVDAIVKGIGKYVYDNAEMLARMAVDETGIGVYEDKILKNKGKARVIWNNLKDKKSRGIIGEDADTNMVFVAKPMGVVGAVTPVTNPIVTPMCNAMFALKTGNAVIFAPHPKAEKCTEHLTDAFMKVVKANGGPDNLVQMVKKGSIEMTQELMKAVDVVVATGGGAMVKSAYSSGRPSFGVGAGNVPVIIDRDVDLKDAVEKIVLGASFDNGIICSHEQFVLAPEEKYAETCSRRSWRPARCGSPRTRRTIQKLRDVVFPGGHLNKDVVGKSPRQVGALAGVDVPETARIILLPAEGAGVEGPPRQGEALPRRGDPALQDVPGSRRERQGQPAGRGRGPLGRPALEQRIQHPRRGHRAADQPARRQPGQLVHGRRLAHQRLRADDDARLRIVGRELDFREPRLQAPDERLAHRQGHHEQEGADRRRDLGVSRGAPRTHQWTPRHFSNASTPSRGATHSPWVASKPVPSGTSAGAFSAG